MSEVEQLVRRNKIGGYLLVGVVAAICAVTVYLFYESIQQGKEITQVQHSACQSNPAGAECQLAKEESSRAANLTVTCIPFFKAGYPCPKPGSTAASRQAQRRAHRQHPVGGGDAFQSPSSATQPSAPATSPAHHGTSTGHSAAPAPHTAGGQQHGTSTAPASTGSPAGEDQADAANETSSTSSTSTESSSTSTTTTESTTAPETGLAPVLSGAGEAVGHVGEGLGHTLEGVGGAAEGLTQPQR